MEKWALASAPRKTSTLLATKAKPCARFVTEEEILRKITHPTNCEKMPRFKTHSTPHWGENPDFVEKNYILKISI